MRVESRRLSEASVPGTLDIDLLGPVSVRRDGLEIELPASRRVRALLVYLALVPRGASRTQLCTLFWDAAADPRGELRWCLSKLRRVLDDAGCTRVFVESDRVRLELVDCRVDAAAVDGLDVHALPPDEAATLAAAFRGEVAEGLELERAPEFEAWLVATRRRFRELQIALLERAASGGGDDVTPHIEKWLQLAPFDPHAHVRLLDRLAASGRIQDAEVHLDAAEKRFAAEGLEFALIRHAWLKRRSALPLTAASPVFPVSKVSPVCAQGELSLDEAGSSATTPAAPRRASIAVMPFREAEEGGQVKWLADALVHDVITRLAKLRSLFVIAQGTVFALAEQHTAPDEAGRLLGVDYLVRGVVRWFGERAHVTVELTQTATGRVAWAEQFESKREEALTVLEEFGNGIVAAVAGEIERLERNRAILRPPASLDAWEAHHRGLWHMYRFTRADNDAARHFFTRAVQLDPTFARAYAGLSFAQWQSAFQGWGERTSEVAAALYSAGRGIMADELDPAVHWAQGRALWLRGEHDQSVAALSRAVDLSPNFAQGHYALAFVQSQAGDAQVAIAASDTSRSLSPCDPLLFGILGARAMALVRLGRFEEAAAAAVEAANRPNAHAHIFAIAACTLALAGRLDEARARMAAVQHAIPGYGMTEFLSAFRFDAEGEGRFREGARLIGVR
jgi:DNA-binding SARP family transcriptional activator/TolB-like protein